MSVWGLLLEVMGDLDEPNVTLVRDRADDYAVKVTWQTRHTGRGEAIGYGPTLSNALEQACLNAKRDAA